MSQREGERLYNDLLSGGLISRSLLSPAQIKHCLAAMGQKVARDIRTAIGTVSVAANPLVIILDEKAAGTEGGTFTAGAWRTRDLNTEVVDTNSLAGLASNQITLEAGTWFILARAPSRNVGFNATRLRNITDGADVLLGSNDFYGGDSFLYGRFVLAAAKVLEIQHRCDLTQYTNGFGVAHSFQTEVYTEVFLERLEE